MLAVVGVRIGTALGERVNPIGAHVPQGLILTGRELDRFHEQQARIDSLVTSAARHQDGRELASRMTDPVVLGLRPALNADIAAAPGREG